MSKRRPPAKFKPGERVAVKNDGKILKLTGRYWYDVPGRYRGWWYEWDAATAPHGYRGMCAMSEKHLCPARRKGAKR